MKTWSLKQRLVAIGLLIGALIPVAGGVALFQVKEIARLNNKIFNGKMVKKRKLEDIVFKLRDLRLNVRTLPIRGMSREMFDQYTESTVSAAKAFQVATEDYKQWLESQEEETAFAELLAAEADFLAFGGELLRLAKNFQSEQLDELARLVREVCPGKAKRVENAVNALVEIQIREASALIEQVEETTARLIQALVTCSILGLMFAAVMMTRMARAITSKLQNVAESLAQGADRIDEASAGVFRHGEKMNQSSVEQKSELDGTVENVKEVGKAIEENARSANDSNRAASLSLELAARGKNQVESLEREIAGLHRNTQDLIAAVSEGNQEMRQILSIFKEVESKTKVINEIVFQTKLLSFNASVEAARAGESGKGFSVVAEEIGTLASMSGNASKEIADLLKASLENVESIIQRTQRRVQGQADTNQKQVEMGLQMAKLCGESLNQILGSASELQQRVSSISDASARQANGSKEIEGSILKINMLSSQNADLSRDCMESARHLNLRAEEMKEQVSTLLELIKGHSAQTYAGSVVSVKTAQAESMAQRIGARAS